MTHLFGLLSDIANSQVGLLFAILFGLFAGFKCRPSAKMGHPRG